MTDAPRAGDVTAPEAGRRLAERLAEAGGDTVRAILMYGSHLSKASPGRHSAYDLVVVVDAYGPFYRALKDAGEVHRPASMFTSLSGVLPPNVIAFTPDEGREGMAKCLVVRADHFEQALGPRPPDHFLLGRMVQRVALVWARSEGDASWVEAALAGARARVLSWVAPYLGAGEEFDATTLGRRLMEVSYRAEVRPEAGNRFDSVFATQADHFAAALVPGLEAAEAEGRLEGTAGGRYRLVEAPDGRTRSYWRRHFLRSKVRATARWFKHVMTFDNWLPYIARKVERRTGVDVELTPLEKKLPVVFLWPRLVRVLRARPETEYDGADEPTQETEG